MYNVTIILHIPTYIYILFIFCYRSHEKQTQGCRLFKGCYERALLLATGQRSKQCFIA